jgi:hypothetical protein
MVETCRARRLFLPGGGVAASFLDGLCRQLARALRVWLVMMAAQTAMSCEINALSERGRHVGGQELRITRQALPSRMEVRACL